MKQTWLDRLIHMAFLLGAAAALTHELFRAFLIPDTFTATIWPLLGLDTAVLLPLTLLVRGRRFFFISLFAWVSAGIALVIYALINLSAIFSSPQQLLYPRLFYVIALPVAALAFYAARTAAGTLLFGICGLGGIAVLSAIGYTMDPLVLALFCLFCAALFLESRLLPFSRRLRLGGMGGFLGAVLAVALVLLLILSHVPALRDLQRVRINDLKTLFGGGLSGFSDDVVTKQLGGSLLTNDTQVLSVIGTAPFYLKGRTYSTYANGAWSVDRSDATPSYTSFESLHPVLGYISAFAPAFMPSYIQTYSYYAYFNGVPVGSLLKTMTVRSLRGGFRTLFLPLGFSQWTSSDIKSVSYQNGSVLAKTNLKAGDAYTLEYPDVTTDNILFRDLEPEYGTKTDDFLQSLRDYSPESYTALLQENAAAEKNDTILPSTITARTRALAKSLTQYCTNSLQASEAIRTWLDDHCQYRTDVSAPPRGAEFVDDFLFRTHVGYCVHFATAMTVLLRAAGYPARYVEGYVSPPGETGNGVHIVTGNESHAWVEVYTKLLGYVVEDPTPGVGSVSLSSSASSSQTSSASSAKASSSSAVSSAAASRTAASSAASRSGGGASAGAQVPVWAVIAAAAAVFALAAAIRLAGRALWFSLLLRRPPNVRVITLYLYCLRFFSRLGCPCGRSETPLRYAHKVERTLGITGFGDVTARYLKARYSGETASDEDCRELFTFCRALPRQARAAKGWAAALFALFTA